MNKPFGNAVVIEGKRSASVAMPKPGEGSLLCPRCWTAQRADRAFCWHCGAEFVWYEELPKPPGKAVGE